MLRASLLGTYISSVSLKYPHFYPIPHLEPRYISYLSSPIYCCPKYLHGPDNLQTHRYMPHRRFYTTSSKRQPNIPLAKEKGDLQRRPIFDIELENVLGEAFRKETPSHLEELVLASTQPSSHRIFSVPPGSLQQLPTQKPSYTRGHSSQTTHLPPLDDSRVVGWAAKKSRRFLSPHAQVGQTNGDGEEGDVNTEEYVHSVISGEKDNTARYNFCLHVIATTQSGNNAWLAYTNILSNPFRPKSSSRPIPFQHLHRICRLFSLSRQRRAHGKYGQVKTGVLLSRLIHVLRNIRSWGGKIHLHEWNTLVDITGKGWRKAKVADWGRALAVFSDMVNGSDPGESLDDLPDEHPISLEYCISPSLQIAPDIVTYNSLLNIAANTHDRAAVTHATELLQSSGLSPDRLTHLSLLKFFAVNQDIRGIFITLTKLKMANMDLGLDGINAIIWAFGNLGRIDNVMNIYAVLREAAHPTGNDDIEVVRRDLENQNIYIPHDMRPNEVTYTSVIQIMAYHGQFNEMVNGFIDMLDTLDIEDGVVHRTRRLESEKYSATVAVYRAIFLGFSRHGQDRTDSLASRLHEGAPWGIRNLRQMFEIFMEDGYVTEISKNVIYWIMVAFGKTTGYNVNEMRNVWIALEKKLDGIRLGPNNRLRILRDVLFSKGAKEYLDRHGFTVVRTQDSTKRQNRLF